LSLSSNFKNISGVPFIDNYAYFIIFCKDNEIIDNLQINIRVTASQKKVINYEETDIVNDDIQDL
jgi:hypothetical protein